MASKVYFTKELTPEAVVKMYDVLGVKLPGKVAVKLHSGEAGNQNFLGPIWVKPLVKHLNATVVECNTAYPGERDTSEKHLKLLKDHGWSTTFKVDLLDEKGPDAVLPIPHGVHLHEDYVGKDLLNYDSLLIFSHFKGHPMGGYGGALKQLSIGCASSFGKLHIHSAGSDKPDEIWTADHDSFLESMAEAASAVVAHFKGKIAYVSVMKNMSVDCDCCSVAEDPCLQDIGILSSLDPIALDQACLDLVMASKDPGKAHFMERVNSRHGIHTIERAVELGYGSREYQLIEVK
ncbi:MAG: hypothetical protein BWY98_01154 [Tenericutes bacterium ADurb.BinA155]|nr:MAG: hypothetical protein BWY98_01154 [Tenericutes bacterium ADurb.BinA155]